MDGDEATPPVETIGDLRARRDALVSKQDWVEAADVVARIGDLPDSDAVDHRVASGVLTQCDRTSDATVYAARACQLAPENSEYAFHAGCVFLQSGDPTRAVGFLLQAARLDPTYPETYQQLATAAERLGSLDFATKLAVRAYMLDPTGVHRGMVAAHFLARLERWDEAVALVHGLIELTDPPPYVYRSLASYLSQTGDHRGALEAIDKAIDLDRLNAEYHGHRAFVLLELDRIEDADAALHRAVELDPTNLSGRRHAVSILVEKGDLVGALRFGGELLSRAPEVPEFADCMRFLLEAKSMSLAAADFSEIAELKRNAPPRRMAEPTTFVQALGIQWRIIMALVLRDVRSRYGESRISLFWMMMEPFVHIGILAIVFQFTMHGSPPMGNDFFLFYFTGVMPYLLLTHLIQHMSSAVRGYRYLMQIPSITPVDLLVAKSIVEMFTTAVIFVVFLGLFQVFGVESTPVRPENVFVAFLITWVLGTGLGCVCAALSEFGAAAETIVGVLLRLVYFTSGIFYVPGRLPLFAREILVWNPFMHVVDYMRVGFFATYEPAWMTIDYAASCAVFALVIGMVAIASLHRRMRAIA